MLNVYTLEQAEKWDSIVRSFKKYDVYWLSGYVKAFKIHGDGEPLLFHYSDSNVRGINVVMKRDVSDDKHFVNVLPKGCYYDFATPYGYGGWIIEGDCNANLFSEYESWIEKNGIICEFVRFHPMIRNHEACSSFYDITQLGEVVHMDLSSPDTIWNNITSKNRNVIRKAIKNDIKVFNGRFPEVFETFRTIYNRTMDENCASGYYYFGGEFYASLLYDLPHNAQVFWAERDDIIIAAAIMLTANGFMNYHLSGSLRDYSSLAPTNLLLYEAALWGCANRLASLYLGGGVGSGEDGLFKFKRSFFKGDINHFYIGKKIFDNDKYKQLVAERSKIRNTMFFPLYRG